MSRSSTEVEYRGVANVVFEICWVRNLLLELHHPPARACLVYCDNVNAIYLSGNPVHHQRTKHIDLDIHFVREQVQRVQIRVLHVPAAYLFTDFRSSRNIREPPVQTAGVYKRRLSMAGPCVMEPALGVAILVNKIYSIR